MSAIIQTATADPSSTEIPERTLLLGLGLTSFAALLLELSLTRLFSVVLFYHFAFLAISIALLGLGAGGVFAYLLKSRQDWHARPSGSPVHRQLGAGIGGVGNRAARAGRTRGVK